MRTVLGGSWVRVIGGAAIIALLAWRLGTGPFLSGVRLVSGEALVAATGIAVATTVCCAWRWRLVARGLGIALPLTSAVAAYYRSQFLNTTLPGGVVGDVHRAVRHGREVGDVGRGVRAVVWERTSGQVVQAVIAVVLLAALPSPARRVVPYVAAALLVAAVAVALLALVAPRHRPARWVRVLHTTWTDLRDAVLARRSWPGIVATSAVVVAGHLATFVIAARLAGATASLAQLVPLSLLALLAMGIPLNVAGFGPREGVAAWAFGAAGLTAAQGVSAAVAYGVLVLVASLPGAVVLIARSKDRTRNDRRPAVVATRPEVALHG